MTMNYSEVKLNGILSELGLEFTQEEVTNLLVEGICTEERPLDDYIILKNVSDALHHVNQAKELLGRNISKTKTEKVIEVFNEHASLKY